MDHVKTLHRISHCVRLMKTATRISWLRINIYSQNTKPSFSVSVCSSASS